MRCANDVKCVSLTKNSTDYGIQVETDDSGFWSNTKKSEINWYNVTNKWHPRIHPELGVAVSEMKLSFGSTPILGVPGATSRDDAVFSCESLLQAPKSAEERLK